MKTKQELFASCYPAIRRRVKRVYRGPKRDREDMVQAALCDLWQRWQSIDIVASDDIYIAELLSMPICWPRHWGQPEREAIHEDSLEIPDCVDAMDGILVAGLAQGDSDSELSRVTGIPRQSVAMAAVGAAERVVPPCFVRSVTAVLSHERSTVVDDIGEIVDYFLFRRQVIGELI